MSPVNSNLRESVRSVQMISAIPDPMMCAARTKRNESLGES